MHSIDTKLQFNGATSPLTSNYTCGTGTTLLVVTIVTGGSTIRAGGAPTYNGVAMTEVYSGIIYATSPEESVDMYYLLAPPTGNVYQISVPNTGTKNLYCVASSYKAQSGYTSAFDVKNSNTGLTTTPTNTVVTTVNGDVIVQVCGDGAQNKPSANSHTLLYSTDDGAYSDNHQYTLQATLGSITLTWTASSDDWASIAGAFKEVVSSDFTYVGSGSYIFSGIATQTYTKDYLTIASGQLAYSGTAIQLYSKNYLYEGSGDLAFSGSAVIIFGLAYIGTGSIAYSGEAIQTYTHNYLYIPTGELIYSGQAIISYLCDFLFLGSGELAYSGSAEQSYSKNLTYVASGEFIYSGSANCSYEIAGENNDIEMSITIMN